MCLVVVQLVMFVEGQGIATARALLEASADVVNLNMDFRKDVRLYYKVCATPCAVHRAVLVCVCVCVVVGGGK